MGRCAVVLVDTGNKLVLTVERCLSQYFLRFLQHQVDRAGARPLRHKVSLLPFKVTSTPVDEDSDEEGAIEGVPTMATQKKLIVLSAT